MKCLILSPYTERLTPALDRYGDQWLSTEDKITPNYLHEHAIEMGISYGYRHILKQDVLDVCPFINMHISYLPWNKGADPNIWSWIDDTPKGVTIHVIDEGIDTGDIIARREVIMAADETLSTSYQKLQEDIVRLFHETWPAIREGQIEYVAQPKECGSIHYVSDKKEIEFLLSDGFDTPVSILQTYKHKDTL